MAQAVGLPALSDLDARVITVVSLPDTGMAGMNVLLLL